MVKDNIQDAVRKKICFLDGATGTELQARGMPDGVCPELWCIDNPECISSIHRDYKDAGADIVYACTFGANRYKLEQYGSVDVGRINRDLALLAKKAAGDSAWVAGDIAPTGRFIEPFGDLGFEDAVNCYKEQALGLIDGGVDLFVIETMIDIQEARAALIAVKEVSDLFVMVSMTYEPHGCTLNGTDPMTALITLQSLGADALGCNCSTGPDDMIHIIRSMKPYAKVPLIAKPNAGLPRLVDGKTTFDMGPEEFKSFGKAFVEAGVNLLGGCCGTTPEHIRALKKEIGGLGPKPPVRESISAVSSARKTKILDKDAPVTIIGERINPTGKKDLQHELAEGKMSLVRTYAREQASAGAGLLDVNAGMPGIDEVGTLKDMVCELAIKQDTPLCIDSSNIEAIETVLRIYPGRALINSISGEEQKLDRLLEIAAKYGSMFILLPLAGRKIPKTCEQRQVIIEDIFAKALVYGFTKDDIIVDAITMAVSADQGAAVETLRTIQWCSKEFGIHTVLGLSNVSFGLPERKWINAAFVAMAASHGLSMAIANPMSDEFMSIKLASDVLTTKDRQATAYIERYSRADRSGPGGSGSGPLAERPEDLPIDKKVYNAVIEGNREDITDIIDQAITQKADLQMLVSDSMIPAIRKVGELYDKKVYFLPQLIASAEAMKKGFEHIEPYLKQAGAKDEKRARVILATVRGDIHDIGKNIVGLMLKNYGFDVIDLGKDVPTQTIVDAIREYNPDIVGLSALMTTTMTNMKDTIEHVVKEGLSCRFMVGGAVVTRTYAQSIGASYAKDGVDAVRVAEGLTAED